ncbi:basic proline-rich protein-like [Homalodisca vitripennis]|uniref:basic proline-rich protein-like n=1 Tax=Homalodisca vitripennis TaxID=197043 RepID=UPI001EE9CEC3|nr:basic proline-rich protein-like [Homalodisca vitripennis]
MSATGSVRDAEHLRNVVNREQDSACCLPFHLGILVAAAHPPPAPLIRARTAAAIARKAHRRRLRERYLTPPREPLPAQIPSPVLSTASPPTQLPRQAHGTSSPVPPASPATIIGSPAAPTAGPPSPPPPPPGPSSTAGSTPPGSPASSLADHPAFELLA